MKYEQMEFGFMKSFSRQNEQAHASIPTEITPNSATKSQSHHRRPAKISARSRRYRKPTLRILGDGKKHPGKEIAEELHLTTPGNISNILSSLQHELLMERNNLRIKCRREGREKIWWVEEMVAG